MSRLSPADNFVDGQINWHVCASYWHAKISHYPGLAPGFFFVDHGISDRCRTRHHEVL